ncbi:phosphatase-like protein [Aspergillus luchuensis]|uniref:Very-long-chain (3R)-3-hydroxyacyl-CoA dehydratase n=1 Tax=Aspergillus kawachii TaxID=1069201 RepID=A0A146FL06_ASPKA|nr:phosphatase-like protein [Aspergillus luchuensis]
MGLSRPYLLLYNAVSLTLWATCTIRGFSQLFFSPNTIPQIFTNVYPLLLTTQSLALLEIIHSLLRLVRAPVLTTAMQVASRILLVWGIMYPFQGVIVGEKSQEVVGLGDYAFLGCLGAWGVTECIRYGFFALQLSGVGVPGWWAWLSECLMVYKALGPAGELVSPLYRWFLIAVLGIYVPGSYILYTHMIKQRRKAMSKK